MAGKHDEAVPEFEALGEAEVLRRFKCGEFNSFTRKEPARAWLELKESVRLTEASAKRDAREEETLSIAKRALSIAEEANLIATRDLSAAREQARWAKWAAIIAAIAAMIATKEEIVALVISWLR